MNVRTVIYTVIVTSAIVGLSSIPQTASAQHWVVDNAWFFRNFGTPELTWEQYRDTFTGTAPNYESGSLDAAFYEGVYKNQISPPGNCYGMSVMAHLIVQKGGHLGFCYPVSQYSGGLTYPGTGPSDSALTYAINLMHGHQLNLNSIKQYLELLALGKTRNGNYAYQQAEYYELSDDPTVVSITKSLSPIDGGHTLMVYDTQDYGSEKRIYVYDPNRSWYTSAGNDWYRLGNNYIKVDPSSGKWEFDMGSSGIWSGSPSSGGNCIVTPLSICGPRDRSPVSMGLDALSYLNQFFIYGSGADVEQITNSEGKRLFVPGTRIVDNDPNTGLLNTAPIFPSDGNAVYDFQSFVMFGNPGGDLDIDITSESGFAFEMAGPRSIMHVEAISANGSGRIHMKNPGMVSPSILLDNSSAAEEFNIKFTQIVKPGRESRVFYLKNMNVPPEGTANILITPDQKGIKVQSKTARLNFNLQIERWTGDEKQTLELQELAVEPGQIQLIKTIDWKNLQIAQPIIKIQPIVIQPIVIDPIFEPVFDPVLVDE